MTTVARLYRLLLRLLPKPFRQAEGGAMEEAFLQAHAAARRGGAGPLLRFYRRELRDMLRAAVTLRRDRGTVARVSRPSRGWHPARELVSDVRFAMRVAERHPTFFLFACLILALGIGASTAVFSALHSIVLKPLPFPGGERVGIPWRNEGRVRLFVTAEQQLALASDRTVLEAAASFSTRNRMLTGAGDAAQLLTLRMSADLPAFMGVQPVLGRFPDASERAGAGAHVAVLSYGVWQTRFAGDRDVLGRTLQLNGETYTVIGVMQRGALSPNGDPTPVDVWLPLATDHQRLSIDGSSLQTVLRLRPGVTFGAASESLTRVIQQLPGGGDTTLEVAPATMLRVGALEAPLKLLIVAVSLLLLIACVNVSNLLLQRAALRRHEMAVRVAMGAGRGRIVRQLLAESMLLAVCGGAAGMGSAWLALRVLARLRPADLPSLQAVSLDPVMLGYALAVSIGAGVAFGLLPALRAGRVHATGTLGRAGRDGAAVSARLRWALVSGEIALSFALLAGATVVISSLRERSNRDHGYDPDGLLALQVTVPPWRYSEPAIRRAFFEDLAATLRRVPGVERVSVASGMPPRGGISFGTPDVQGEALREGQSVFFTVDADSGWLRTMGATLIAGRDFTAEEINGTRAALIVDEAAARALFPDGDAIGRRFRLNDAAYSEVVGVMRRFSMMGASYDDSKTLIWPMTEVYAGSRIAVRATDITAELTDRLQSVVRSLEPDAIVQLETSRTQLRASLARERLTTGLLTAFAAFALLLSAAGLYGVLAHIVTERRREIGIRLSLGAQPAGIRRLALRGGLGATALGLMLGAALTIAGLRLLRSNILGLGELRPTSLVAAAAVTLVVALLALWLPAERAARVDPMVSLRDG